MKTENAPDAALREKYGKRAGMLGIALNVLLAAGKIAVGAISGAISILADGFNNLTDCGSNVISVIGFKMSGKPADKEHPFGHQRAEYISSLLIAMIILVVAVELAIQSAEKIFSPSPTQFSWLLVGVLGASILVKLFMFFFNCALAKKLNADTLRATATDSVSDVIATSAVLASLLISEFAPCIDLDGYMGAAVAVFIAFAGGSILKETVSRLLGRAPEKEVVEDIRARILAFEGVHGLHDLTVHNYGQNKLYATAHVEVDAHMSVMQAHDLADEIERAFAENTDILLTVHIDPLVLDDPKVNRLRTELEHIVADIDPAFRLHDFRLVGGITHSNLVFDLAVPFDCKQTAEEIVQKIRDRVELLGENFGVVVTVEKQNLD